MDKLSTLQRPTTDDPDAWKAYWTAQGWSWRTEPEIDAERQKYLTVRRKIQPDIEHGIFSFKDIEPKLSRADVEWLLATHESNGVVGPVNWSNQQERYGLDLRGADLRGLNLSNLPLARTLGSLNLDEWEKATPEQRAMAKIHLEHANFYDAHLEHSYLLGAHLEWASLHDAHLEGAKLRLAHLEAAELRGSFFDTFSYLKNIVIAKGTRDAISLVDVHWGDANLAVVKWSQMLRVGDELKLLSCDNKERDMQLEEAIRAYRQLSTVLQTQGLYEDGSRYAYRARKLQRIVLRREKKFGQYLFSLFLDLLAGYGYRPGRSVLWYLAVIFGFALAYFAIGHLPFFPDAFVFSLTSFHGRGFFPGLGSENALHNPLVVIAAFEAVVGLLIEISFIATFTQRFFGK